MWCDLRVLESRVGQRYLTHFSDDERWEQFRAENSLPTWGLLGQKGEGLYISPLEPGAAGGARA